MGEDGFKSHTEGINQIKISYSEYVLVKIVIWIPMAVNKLLEIERQSGGKTSSSGMRVAQEVLEIFILKGIENTQLSQAFHLSQVPVVALGLYENDAVVWGGNEEGNIDQSVPNSLFTNWYTEPAEYIQLIYSDLSRWHADPSQDKFCPTQWPSYIFTGLNCISLIVYFAGN